MVKLLINDKCLSKRVLSIFRKDIKIYIWNLSPKNFFVFIISEIVIFKACSCHNSSLNIWSIETLIDHFCTISNPNQYGGKNLSPWTWPRSNRSGIKKCTMYFYISWSIWISFQKSKTMIRREIKLLSVNSCL